MVQLKDQTNVERKIASRDDEGLLNSDRNREELHLPYVDSLTDVNHRTPRDFGVWVRAYFGAEGAGTKNWWALDLLLARCKSSAIVF